jgi:hypothetical protein
MLMEFDKVCDSVVNHNGSFTKVIQLEAGGPAQHVEGEKIAQRSHHETREIQKGE